MRGLRLAALDPSPKGYGYVLFEDTVLRDWGIAVLADRSARTFRDRLGKHLERLRPSLLVLEHPEETVRRARACRRIRMAAEIASAKGIDVAYATRPLVKQHFGAGNVTKIGIARQLGERYPELTRFAPRRRRPWMSEDERMAIFDAASFALTVLRDRTS